MEKYKNPNRELEKQYEAQKAFIIAKKNMNLRYENRTQELNIIKSNAQKNSSKQSSPSTKSTSPKSISNNSVSQTKISSKNINEVLNTETTKPVSPTSQSAKISTKNITKRNNTPWYQVIKNWFLKDKKAIANFFSSPTTSEVPSSQDYLVNSHIINKSNTPKNNSTYNYMNNSQCSGSSRVDRVSNVSGVSKTKNDFRDSLVLANLIRQEEQNRAAKKSADINSLEFSKCLQQSQLANSKQNNKIISSRTNEER